MWNPSRCSNGVRHFSGHETLCVFAAIYRATFLCTSRRRRHRGLPSACARRPLFHAFSGQLGSLTRRSWCRSISPKTCKRFPNRIKMTKKPITRARNRPVVTTPSWYEPDVWMNRQNEDILHRPLLYNTSYSWGSWRICETANMTVYDSIVSTRS